MIRNSKLNKSLNEEVIYSLSKNISEKPYIFKDHDVEITVWPEFIDSKSINPSNLFIWAYHVRIENRGAKPVKLLSRYWKIIDEQGEIQEINGEGVIGETPIISPGQHYQYSSGVHLKNPSGVMMGRYSMIKTETNTYQESFHVKIPTFSLDVPNLKTTIN